MSAKKKPRALPTDPVTRKKRTKKAKGRDPKELSLDQRLIKALAHPLRVRILAYMNDREWSPNEIAEELNEGLSQVSYHIKVLKDYKMIEMTRTRPARGAVEHFYRAIERAYIPSWMAKLLPKSAKQIIGSNILEAIEEDLVASVSSGAFYERDDCHATYMPVILDDIGCAEADEVANEALAQIIKIAGKSANRLADGEGDGKRISATAALLVFPSALSDDRRKSLAEGS